MRWLPLATIAILTPGGSILTRDVRIMKDLHQYVSDFSARLGDAVNSSVVHHKHLSKIALLLTLIAGGISTIPGGSLRALQSFAADPIGSRLFSTYHGETPFFFFLAKGIGATTLPRYLGLCGGLIVLGYLLTFILMQASKLRY